MSCKYFLLCWKHGLPVALHVLVVSSLQHSTVNEAAITQGYALQIAESRKIVLHDVNY